MRNPEYQFVPTDAQELETLMISAYERITGVTVNPASPERLFIAWVSAIILQERVLNNYTGNQNIPSRAEGQNLDALAELFYANQRPQAKPASCTERFYISAAQATSILIPAGTRVTDASQTAYWETVEDVYVSIGDTYADVQIRCQTAGISGNGYAAGQINTIVDLFPYYTRCENLSETDGGSDAATDEEFYELMRQSMDAYSTAGSVGSYIYHAKSVSGEIADVAAIRPSETVVVTLAPYGPKNVSAGGDAYSRYFLGGESLKPETMVVYLTDPDSPWVLNEDYEYTYEDGLLTIHRLASSPIKEPSIYVQIETDCGGHVQIYTLMNDGTAAGQTIKDAVLEACSDRTVRPLTDYVTVEDAEAVSYDIVFTFYIPSGSATSSAEIETAVNAAVAEYQKWQCAKLGRDINPDKLREFLSRTGIKRIELTEPTFTVLRKDGSAPQYATVDSVTIINGGLEDE